MLLAAAVWGGVISVLVTWWSGPDNAQQLDAFKPGRFDLMGTVPVAYALFAMALGIAAGALLRRVLPAIVVTLAGFIAARAVPQSDNVPYAFGIPQTSLPASRAPLLHSTGNPTPVCAQALSHFRAFLTYQPADRYWTFQGIETGIFLALTAALIGVTAFAVLRRDA
jgi:hypothetical protein